MTTVARKYGLTIFPVMGIATAGWFFVRRACFNWRAELCDRDIGVYPAAHEDDMDHIRLPGNDLARARARVPCGMNPGMYMEEEFLAPEEQSMLLEEAERWAKLYGRPLDDDRRARDKRALSEVGIAPAFVDATVVVSDIMEDPRPPRTPWGTGDDIALDRMPELLRAVNYRVLDVFPRLGRLRSVKLVYSPTGQWYAPPRVPHAFIGHEYVILPLAGPNGLVATFSPDQRSKNSSLRDTIAQCGWTASDIDVYMPAGSLLRVYAQARFRWGWGIRPHQYLGHPFDALPLQDAAAAAQPKAAASWFGAAPPALAPLPCSNQPPPGHEKQAYLVMGYEGPVTEIKQRKKYRRWEIYAYGEPPSAESFKGFTAEDSAPLPEELGGTKILWWIAQNYLRLGKF
jgi:hypothetical protein